MLATTLLRDHYRRLEHLIQHVAQERASRLPLVLQLVEELMTHLSIEDHLFLSRIADATGMRVDKYREDQALVRNAVLQAVFVEDDDKAFAGRLRELASAFERHARVMERDLLPLVEAQLRPEELEAIGSRMESYWEAAVGVTGGRPVRSSHVHAAE